MLHIFKNACLRSTVQIYKVREKVLRIAAIPYKTVIVRYHSL